MRKKSRKILIIILAIILIISLLASTIYTIASGLIARGEELPSLNLPDNEKDVWPTDKKLSVFEIWENFTNSYEDRLGGGEGELLAAQYLKDVSKDFGYQPYAADYFQPFSYFVEPVDSSRQEGQMMYSQNVVSVKKSQNNSKGKSVIIGAHYDNITKGGEEKNSFGAYDNASGVASLLGIMENLREVELDFDVIFAFFGMEEIGLIGSQNFVSKMSETEKANTLLMINLDVVGMGDYLYLYTDEIAWDHEDIFFDVASEQNAELTKIPDDKKTFAVYAFDKPYQHVGLMSDHRYFMSAGIPVANFLGYNLISKSVYGGTEKENHDDIMHTGEDNFDYILNLYGRDFLEKRFEDVANVVSETLQRSDFMSVMESSRVNDPTIDLFYSRIFIFGGSFGVFAIFLIVFFILLNKEKKVLPPSVKVPVRSAPQRNVFDELSSGDHNDMDASIDERDIFGL